MRSCFLILPLGYFKFLTTNNELNQTFRKQRRQLRKLPWTYLSNHKHVNNIQKKFIHHTYQGLGCTESQNAAADHWPASWLVLVYTICRVGRTLWRLCHQHLLLEPKKKYTLFKNVYYCNKSVKAWPWWGMSINFKTICKLGLFRA